MINQRNNFRFFKLCEVHDGVYIIDSFDSKIEKVSYIFMEKLKEYGVVINDFKDYPIGVSTVDCTYKVDVLGRNDIFEGSFPVEFDGKMLYNHIITAPNGAIVAHGHIIIEVICKCWIELDYELPVSMTQYVAFPLDDNLSSGFIMAYTSSPVHICHTEDEFKSLKDDFGDKLPSDFCILVDNLSVHLEKPEVFGVDLRQNGLVHDFDLCSQMLFM